ncbi:hypothetical protein OSH00_19965 [Acinetobacter sp. A-IN1]|uniref:Uncharacterized protein n=2 Tax=Acinetobacter nematophilus TaxID=2994642 RepID=A0A9X3DXI4_9GAMM|nr:hypothetical protein [Acinetobacter nematophilus]
MAPVLLIGLRFIQGFAVGRESDGAILSLGEHSPNHQHGFFWGGFPQSAISDGNIGLIIWVFLHFSAISSGNYATIFVMMCIGLLF